MNPEFKAKFGALPKCGCHADHAACRGALPRSRRHFALLSIPTRTGLCADKKFLNKISRVIIGCSDGGSRTTIAAEMVTKMGYTAIYTIEGGLDAYMKVSPLKPADLRPRVKRVEQFVGVKYGGTGVTSESTPDDSA